MSEDERDAKRYRWLRDNAYGTNKSIYFETMIDGNVEDIDAAVDAAMSNTGTASEEDRASH